MGERSDFNDLQLEKGLGAVKEQLLRAAERFQNMRQGDAPVFEEIPTEAYIDAPEERQPLLGDKQVSDGQKIKFDLGSILGRYRYELPDGGAWDTEEKTYLTPQQFRNTVGTPLAKQFRESPDKLCIEKKEIHEFRRAQAAEKQAAKPPCWEDCLQKTDKGEIKADIANVKLVLDNDPEWIGVIGYCQFSYRVMKVKAPPFTMSYEGEWEDADTDRLRIWLSSKYGFTPKSADAHGAVMVVAEENGFHPVRDYLKGLEWDGVCRINSWLSTYLGADPIEYHFLVGQMWLISAIARVMQPPVKVDTVLIFEGLQGLGKSTALKVLGGDWFTDTPLVLGDKDSFQQMQGVWIIELAELDSLNKAESTRAKQFFGSSSDRYRPSYGRIPKTFHRQCVFAGSTNQESYFKDATGNRRYWPVSCTKVDRDALIRDRDQLWAEAYHRYIAGTKWWPGDKHKHLFESQQDERFDVDVWEEMIEKWLVSHTRERVLISEIMEDALGLVAAQMKPPEQKRVGLIMSRLKWSRVRPRVAGKRETGYMRPKGFGLGESGTDDTSGF